VAPPALAGVAWFALAARGTTLSRAPSAGTWCWWPWSRSASSPSTANSGSHPDSGPSLSPMPSRLPARWNR